ncbi:hypothetical protein RDI58_012103 [Solanum bulbocastanum]|uniref:BRISC and BRCA1-A complex member 2 n=1 Tax=Solanum bulbocastanum TaxID=147425 RepID=A0AAN8TWF8_SOLBU
MAIDVVPPLIAAQLNYLVTHAPFSVKVENMCSGGKNTGLFDRFSLVIPFCLDYIKWDVIYNAVYPLAAPDVIFGAEDETFRPYHAVSDASDSKSLKNPLNDWNNRDPTSLFTLVLQLRELYKAYQKKRVEQVDDDRLKFEISTMLSREGIEMSLSSNIDKPEEVKFAVPLLDLDLNKMVAGSTWRHPQKIYLQVIYPVGRKYSSVPSAPRLKLVSSPELKAVFSIDDFRLPAWLDGMCMAEYLPTLEEMLESQIKDAVASIESRRKLIMALAPLFGRPVEADPLFCRKATFLSSSGVFTFLEGHTSQLLPFHSSVCAYFVQALLMHFNSQGLPIKSPVTTEYPWSPRWETSDMAERIFDFIVEECLNFKKYCNESMLQNR